MKRVISAAVLLPIVFAVLWPDGTTTEKKNVQANQVFVVRQQ